MEKKMRLELLLAGPPTKKCKHLQEMFKTFVAEKPKIRLNVYYAGSAIMVPTTKGYQKTINKRIKIPMAFINGTPIPKEFHSDIDKMRSFLEEEYEKGESEWQE